LARRDSQHAPAHHRKIGESGVTGILLAPCVIGADRMICFHANASFVNSCVRKDETEHFPGAGQTLQFVRPCFLEVQSRTLEEVVCRS
jgi:hypothetical protein